MAFNFKEKIVAEALRDSVKPRQSPPSVRPTSLLTHSLIFQAPSGGISGASGTTLGKADCVPYFIDVDATTGVGTRTELKDNAGNSQAFTVYNYVQADIAGDAYFFGSLIFNVWCVASEDCG